MDHKQKTFSPTIKQYGGNPSNKTADLSTIQLQKLIEEGFRCYKTQQYEQAKNYYSQALKLTQPIPQVYPRLAQIQQLLQLLYDFSNTTQYVQRLVTLDPKAASSQMVATIRQKCQIVANYREIKVPYIDDPQRLNSKYVQFNDFQSNQTNNAKSKNQIQKQESQNRYKFHLSLNQITISKLKSLRPIKVKNPGLYPYKAVGFIKSRFTAIDKTEYQQNGTGCLIGKNIVLTAAHLLYQIEHNLQSTEVIYMPASEFPEGTGYRARNWFVPLQFKINQTQEIFSNQPVNTFDFAIIYLDTQEDLERKYGSFCYDFNWQETAERFKGGNQSEIIIQNMKVLGFPLNSVKIHQYTEFEGEALVHKNGLLYNYPTEKGTSGAPNAELVNGQYFVRAIHARNITNIGKNMMGYNLKAGLQLHGRMFENILRNFTYVVSEYWLQKCQSYSFNTSQLQQDKLIPVLIKMIKIRQTKNKLWINLNRRNIQPWGCQLLASTSWPNLQKLQLNNNLIGDQGCRFLSKANWPNLQKLYLFCNNIGGEGCTHLVSASWPNLQGIWLANNQIDAQACQNLAKAQWPSLKILQLWENKVGAQACRYLANSKWYNLHILWFTSNQIGDLGCYHLASANWFNVRTIWLTGNMIGDQGCQHLASAQWVNLHAIHLQLNRIGDEGCRNLASGHQWRNLHILTLQNNKIGDQGCKHLLAGMGDRWPNLKKLWLYNNKNIGEQTKSRLSSIDINIIY